MTVTKSTAAPTREAEQALWAHGHNYIAGVDEVGRGCLAGPVTVAAVVLPPRCELPGVADSKRLTARQRSRAAEDIKLQALAIGIGWASCGEIDRFGLTLAQQRAGERALAQLALEYTAVILDGHHNYLNTSAPVQLITRGDQSCLAVAAAAVVAKVARDNYMKLVDRQFPGYGFAGHKGYGSRQHLQALKQLGATIYHRYSYQPVRALTDVG